MMSDIGAEREKRAPPSGSLTLNLAISRSAKGSFFLGSGDQTLNR
jgi:hypothetical protein